MKQKVVCLFNKKWKIIKSHQIAGDNIKPMERFVDQSSIWLMMALDTANTSSALLVFSSHWFGLNS